MRPLRPALTLLALLLALPAAAQQFKFKRSAPRASSPAEDEAAKRSLFDAACGSDVDLEQKLGMAQRVPLGQAWNQEDVNDCWAYTGCMGLEYVQRRRGQASAPINRCDPTLTAVAVKLGMGAPLYDQYKDGVRQTQFVAADAFQNFPERLKKSSFPLQKGVEDLCRPNGCYCARAMDQDIPGPLMFRAYYEAQEIVLRHLDRVAERKLSLQKALPSMDTPEAAVYDDPHEAALKIAAELDAAQNPRLPGLIRSALDDATLERLARQAQAFGLAGRPADNRVFAKAVLKQSCMPVPVPAGMRLTEAPAAMGDGDRVAMIDAPLARRETMGKLFDFMTGKLDEGTPVMIGFCSKLLGSSDGDYLGTKRPKPAPVPTPGPTPTPAPKTSATADDSEQDPCGSHAVILVGRKTIGGRCYLGIRNSWGDKKDYANPEVRYASPGTVWIPAYLLLQNTFSAGTFE